MRAADLIERVRLEEHTGENRCLPCTGVNAALAVLAALCVALLLSTAGPTLAIAGGSVVGLASATLIYLRGYLVPGTPWLTRTFLPDRVLRWFDPSHVPADGATADRSSTPDADDSSEFDVETTFPAADVVTECADEDDLRLTTSFRSAWRDGMADLNDGRDLTEGIAAFLRTDATELSVAETDRNVVARTDARPLGKWESRPALIADLAADDVLSERVADWSALDVHRRSSVLQGLRVFLDRCPDCEGSVSVGERTVDSCCRSATVVAVNCEDCAARIAEIEQPSVHHD